MTDGVKRVARRGVGRIPERDLRQAVRLDLEDRHVRGRIAADDVRLDVATVLQRDGDLVGVLQDRKSTRLNSSHSQISYAVFCLKKKKKQSLCAPYAHFQTDNHNHTQTDPY